MLGNTGFSFKTPLQLLDMQHAKCSVFTGVKEDWDRWSMEWKAYLQVMKGVVGGEDVMVLATPQDAYARVHESAVDGTRKHCQTTDVRRTLG